MPSSVVAVAHEPNTTSSKQALAKRLFKVTSAAQFQTGDRFELQLLKDEKNKNEKRHHTLPLIRVSAKSTLFSNFAKG